MNRIAPTPERPEPNPSTGGEWVRDADGGITPMNEKTALAAGLEWIQPTPPKTEKRQHKEQ